MATSQNVPEVLTQSKPATKQKPTDKKKPAPKATVLEWIRNGYQFPGKPAPGGAR